MKLLTSEIKKRLAKYPTYSQDGKKKEAVAVCKFFLCQGAWTWYVLECDAEYNIAYGITINGAGEGEYGYFSLPELQKVRTRYGLGVERDIYFKPTKLGDIKDDTYLKIFLSKLYDKEDEQ